MIYINVKAKPSCLSCVFGFTFPCHFMRIVARTRWAKTGQTRKMAGNKVKCLRYIHLLGGRYGRKCCVLCVSVNAAFLVPHATLKALRESCQNTFLQPSKYKEFS